MVATSTDGGNTFTRFTGVDFQANIPVANINGVAQPPIVGVDKWQIATGLSGPNSTAQAVYIAIYVNPPSHTMIAGSRDGGVTFRSQGLSTIQSSTSAAMRARPSAQTENCT